MSKKNVQYSLIQQAHFFFISFGRIFPIHCSHFPTVFESLDQRFQSEDTVVMECLMIKNVISSTQGSFRGGLSASPQRSSASPRRRPDENAVVHFFRTIVRISLTSFSRLSHHTIKRQNNYSFMDDFHCILLYPQLGFSLYPQIQGKSQFSEVDTCSLSRSLLTLCFR